MTKFRLPFRHLTGRQWENLGLVALTEYYLIWFIVPILQRLFFVSLASDYLALWSAGWIANHLGYAKVYDLQTLIEVQRPLVPNPAPNALTFSPVPAPYIPVFLLPFQLLALLPPQASYWAWTLLNALALVLWLRGYARRVSDSPERRILILLLLTFPVFNNFFWGQLNIWLTICVGEFFWHWRERRPWRAGAWLAGLLLKPQLLILLIPALLLQRSWKVIFSFSLTSAVIGLASLALWGREGLLAFLSLSRSWGSETPNLAVINQANMMNWRMVGYHLATFFGDSWERAVTWGGTLFTAVLALWPWRKPSSITNRMALSLMAGTLLATWHSHYHMAMVLLPLLLIALQRRSIPPGGARWWLFLPPLVQAFTLVLSIILHDAAWLPYGRQYSSFLTGLAMLGTTLCFVCLPYTRKENAP